MDIVSLWCVAFAVYWRRSLFDFPSQKWRKRDGVLEELAATLLMAKSFVWLQFQSQSTTARRVLPLFDPDNLAVIVPGHLQKAQRLISWATSCVACVNALGAFGMYVWFGRGFQYVDTAQLARCLGSRQHVSGLVCRLFEHLTLRARAGRQQMFAVTALPGSFSLLL